MIFIDSENSNLSHTHTHTQTQSHTHTNTNTHVYVRFVNRRPQAKQAFSIVSGNGWSREWRRWRRCVCLCTQQLTTSLVSVLSNKPHAPRPQHARAPSPAFSTSPRAWLSTVCLGIFVSTEIYSYISVCVCVCVCVCVLCATSL